MSRVDFSRPGLNSLARASRMNAMNGALGDATLVIQAKAGDLAAFETLVSRYEGQVYALALRILRHPQDAQDATQQAFLSVIEHLTGFREESSFATWLMRIVTHAALKIIRKRRGLDTVSLEENTEPQDDTEAIAHPEYIADWSQSPEELAERNETARLIDSALEELDEKHRLVFILRDVEGFSIEETAAELGISQNNVKVRLLRARLRLREILTRAFGDPATRITRGEHHH